MPLDIHLFDAELARIREALRIPREFSTAALAEAERVVARNPLSDPGRDHSFLDVPFLTLDPPGSRDLDQAFYAERDGDDGYLVRYAIADIGFFVKRGGALDEEAWRRGLTFYSPDRRMPLYPPLLGEGAASLLANETRPSIVFTFALNAGAEVKKVRVDRALVRSRVQLNYLEVNLHLARERQQIGSGSLAGHEWSPSLSLLEEIGRKRKEIEIARGAVSLPLPTQQVEPWRAALSGYRLVFEEDLDVEKWNEQISLMTGMAAAEIMLAHGVGLLRVLDEPRPDRLRALRLTAGMLNVDWPAQMAYNDFVRTLDSRRPNQLALLHQATKVMGGARYLAINGSGGGAPARARHAAIAAPYAHTTAPLRRLADRDVLDLLVELTAGRSPSTESVGRLSKLPPVMQGAEYRANMLESAIVNFAEASLLKPRVNEVFVGLVIDRRQDGVEVQIADPPVRTAVRIPPTSKVQLRLGQEVMLRLEGADPQMRSVRFAPLNNKGENLI
jgi:exoribonuclease R